MVKLTTVIGVLAASSTILANNQEQSSGYDTTNGNTETERIHPGIQEAKEKAVEKDEKQAPKEQRQQQFAHGPWAQFGGNAQFGQFGAQRGFAPFTGPEQKGQQAINGGYNGAYNGAYNGGNGGYGYGGNYGSYNGGYGGPYYGGNQYGWGGRGPYF